MPIRRFTEKALKMKYHLISAAILVAALGLYALGLGRGTLALLIAGGALELWFWIRVIRTSNARSGTNS